MAHLADLIKYEGDNTTFVWKHPCEDFNSMTQLIVHESQEAIFLMNGEALDLFGPGRYTLETQNIPKIGKFLNRQVGDETPFHCEVYFINQTVQMDIKWGTDSKVRYLDPDTGIPLELGASGSMNMRVCDSRKLLTKLVGTMRGIAWGDNGIGFTKSIRDSFRPMISTAIKSNLTPAIKEKNIFILEIDEHLDELSSVLANKIRPGFEEYGITIPNFYVTTIVLPEENSNFRRLKELQTILLQTRVIKAEQTVKTAQIQADAAVRSAAAQGEADVTAARRAIEMEKQTTETEIAKREAERVLIKTQAEAEARKLEGFAEAEVTQAKGMAEATVMHGKGYTQKDVLESDVQKAWAEGVANMGSGNSTVINGTPGGTGNMTGDLVGMMTSFKMAEKMMDKMDGVFNKMDDTQKPSGDVDASSEPSPATDTINCPNCGVSLPVKAKFCLECGNRIEVLGSNECICPVCGKKTPKGKFCIECGASLVHRCSKCGAELHENSKFCLECGEKI